MHRGPESFDVIVDIVPLPNASGFEAGYFRSGEMKDGTPCMKGVFLIAQSTGIAGFPQAQRDRYGVNYPDLPLGCVVRVVDGVYRVTTLNPLKFVRLSEPELPKGVAPSENTYAFPLGGGGGLHQVSIKVADLHSIDEEGRVNVEVSLTETIRKPTGMGLTQRTTVHTVHAESRLHIGGKVHAVRQVVPHDPAKKLLGWIEIDQKPADGKGTNE